jgi:hypothetical protein
VHGCDSQLQSSPQVFSHNALYLSLFPMRVSCSAQIIWINASCIQNYWLYDIIVHSLRLETLICVLPGSAAIVAAVSKKNNGYSHQSSWYFKHNFVGKDVMYSNDSKIIELFSNILSQTSGWLSVWPFTYLSISCFEILHRIPPSRQSNLSSGKKRDSV